MKTVNVVGLFLLSFLFGAVLQPRVASSQATSEKTFSVEQLDQMLAPIALYPDELLANVLMASTYPLDVVQAARWRKEPANTKLKGDALTKALEAKSWDPSVKALTMFPDVLQTMSDKLEWTQSLGDAFLAQEGEVFARVQYLRQKADEAGNLKTTEQQKVTKRSNPETRTEYIVIEPAQPEVIYVPVYQPTVVYGSWWYPSYPPYYWNWYPGATFVRGFYWGAGFAIANNIWGWNNCNWYRGNIDIDVNRYNNINVNRPKISNNTWEHNPAHRGAVPYRDKATREKFGKDANLRDRSKDFSGHDRDKLDKSRDVDRVKDKLGDNSGNKFKDAAKNADVGKAKDKAKDLDIDKARDKAGDRTPGKSKDIADRPRTKDVKPAAKDVRKPVQKPAAKALDVKPKAQVKQHADRGGASRAAARSHPAARSGGGGKARGGGGRRR